MVNPGGPSVAVDTSVAVPLLVRSHEEHATVAAWAAGRALALAGHALAETYAVLTRLPGDARVEPGDTCRLLRSRFGAPILLGARTSRRLPDVLAALGIAGGAVYDAMIAIAALEHGCELATRDARAKSTYEAVGASVIVVG